MRNGGSQKCSACQRYLPPVGQLVRLFFFSQVGPICITRRVTCSDSAWQGESVAEEAWQFRFHLFTRGKKRFFVLAVFLFLINLPRILNVLVALDFRFLYQLMLPPFASHRATALLHPASNLNVPFARGSPGTTVAERQPEEKGSNENKHKNKPCTKSGTLLSDDDDVCRC